MAIYEYEILGPDGSPRGIYEAEQKMSDPALTHHPQTGERLRRILSVTFAHGTRAEGSVCESGSCDSGSGLSDAACGCSSGVCGWN